MTSDEIEDKYPHWRTALFGNHNAVANIRCAIHYVFWHSLYTLIAVAGALVVGLFKLGKMLSPLFGPLESRVARGFDWLIGGVSTIVNHPYTKKAGEYGAIAFVLFAAGYFAGLIIWMLLYDPLMLAAVVVVIPVGCGVVIGIFAAYDKLRNPAASAANSAAVTARAAGERAVETPGIRRIYGECPVSLGQPPKWFDNMFPEND
jgi:hypothetical protein